MQVVSLNGGKENTKQQHPYHAIEATPYALKEKEYLTKVDQQSFASER